VPISYDFPTDAVLTQIDKDLLDDRVMDDPIFDEFPMVMTDDHLVVWEQQDNTSGLMQARGLNGDLAGRQATGRQALPVRARGVYGEYLPIDELELTRRRPWGQFSGKVDVTTWSPNARCSCRPGR
jgi:hypothetical protein